MLGSSFHEYIGIRFCIFIFRFTPALYVGAIVALFGTLGWESARSSATIQVLIVLAILEGLFALTIYFPYTARLRSEAKHPPLGSWKERQDLFEKCVANITDLEEYLRLWFLGADMSDIRREDIRKFLFWGFLDIDPAASDEILDDEVEGYLNRVEELLGWKLEPGTGKAECLRLTLDKVETQYRSLLWYGVVFLVDLTTHLTLSRNGFQYHAQHLRKGAKVFPPRLQTFLSTRRTVASDLSYWHRPHTAAGKLPIVFFHGIGIGLMTYINFMLEVNSGSEGSEGGQIGIIAFEILPVSFRLTEEPLAKEEFVRQATKILDHHGFDKFVLISHSYGSVLTTHMVRTQAMESRISSIVLIDPVSVLLHLPNVAYNFTRRRPKTAGERQLWYFASMDPGVAHVLGRHFFWRDNILWKEELTGVDLTAPQGQGVATARTKTPRKAAVCLAGKDLIVDTATVGRYLKGDGGLLDTGARKEGVMNGHGEGRPAEAPHQHLMPPRSHIETVLFSQLDHAQVFDTQKNREKVLSIVRAFCSS